MGVADAANDRRTWWRLFLLLLVMSAVWALAVPLVTGPDERDQAIRAAAVARGEIAGDTAEGWDNLFVEVRVPEVFATADPNCFMGWMHRTFVVPPATRTEDCDSMTGDSHLVTTTTYEHRNQPLYFFAVGVPTLALPNETGAYLMRFVAALLCCAFLASGLVSLRRLARDHPLVLYGVAVAFTPTVFYLSGTVNSMGLEIAASFGLWAAGLAIVKGPAEIDPRLVRRLGVALVVLVLTRGGSPMFAAIILGSLALLAGRDRLAQLWRRSDLRRWMAAALAATVASLGWLYYVHVEYPLQERPGSGFGDAVSELPWFGREMVGIFGSTDVVPPFALHVLWAVAGVVLVVLAWLQGGRRDLLLGLALGAGGVAILVSGEGFSFPQTGYFWQGRYVLPMIIGAVLVASVSGPPAESAGAGRPWRRGLPLLPVLLVCHLWALLHVMRHYNTGFDGSRNRFRFLFDPIWSPPLLPPLVLVALAIVGLVGLGLVLFRGVEDEPGADDAAALTPDDQLQPVGAT